MSIYSYNPGYNPNNNFNIYQKRNDVKANPDSVKEEKKMEVKKEPSTQNSTKTEYGDNFSKEAFLVNNNIEIVPTGQETIQYTHKNPDNPDVNQDPKTDPDSDKNGGSDDKKGNDDQKQTKLEQKKEAVTNLAKGIVKGIITTAKDWFGL